MSTKRHLTGCQVPFGLFYIVHRNPAVGDLTPGAVGIGFQNIHLGAVIQVAYDRIIGTGAAADTETICGNGLGNCLGGVPGGAVQNHILHGYPPLGDLTPLYTANHLTLGDGDHFIGSQEVNHGVRCTGTATDTEPVLHIYSAGHLIGSAVIGRTTLVGITGGCFSRPARHGLTPRP